MDREAVTESSMSRGILSPPTETRQVPYLVQYKENVYYTYTFLHKGLTIKDCIWSFKAKHGLNSMCRKQLKEETCVHCMDIKESREDYAGEIVR